MSTLWDLEGRSSAEFMKDFYKHLGHDSKTEALRMQRSICPAVVLDCITGRVMNTPTGFPRSCRPVGRGLIESGEKLVEVLSRELPFARFCRKTPSGIEIQEALCESAQIAEVVGRKLKSRFQPD